MDIRWGWASHWNKFSGSNVGATLEDLMVRAVDVRDPGLEPWNSHDAPRWWRGKPKGSWRDLKPRLVKWSIRLMERKRARAAG